MLVTVMACDIGIVVLHASFLPWFHEIFRVFRVTSPSAIVYWIAAVGPMDGWKQQSAAKWIPRRVSQKYRLNLGSKQRHPPTGDPQMCGEFLFGSVFFKGISDATVILSVCLAMSMTLLCRVCQKIKRCLQKVI